MKARSKKTYEFGRTLDEPVHITMAMALPSLENCGAWYEVVDMNPPWLDVVHGVLRGSSTVASAGKGVGD